MTEIYRIEKYINAQKYREALNLCSEILYTDSNNNEVLYWRALANCMLGYYKEAICDYDNIIKKNPNHAEVYNNRGSAKVYLGLHKSAVDDFTDAINLKPQLYECYIGRINALTNLEELDKATADCDYLISKGQFLDLVYSHYAYLELKMGHHEKALQCCNLALQYNSLQIWGYLHRATIILVKDQPMEQYKAAIKDCINAIKIDPTCPIAYFNMGICYYKLGNYKLSFDNYIKAIKTIETYKNKSFIDRINICDIYLRIAQLFPIGDDRSYYFREAYEKALINWNSNDNSKLYLYKYKAFIEDYTHNKNKIFEKTILDETVWFSDFIKLNDSRDGYVIQQIKDIPSEIDLRGFRELSFARQCDFKDVNDEETMWGYYADGGNGVCFVYELDLSKISGKPYAFSDVRYIHRLSYMNNTFSTQDFINARLFTKTPLWKNEYESRIITYDKKYVENSAGVSISAESIGLKLIKIRFGCRCNIEKISFIIELVNSNTKLDIGFTKLIHVGDALGNGEFQETCI